MVRQPRCRLSRPGAAGAGPGQFIFSRKRSDAILFGMGIVQASPEGAAPAQLDDDDQLVFADDDEELGSADSNRPSTPVATRAEERWVVLVVDDDPVVHDVTSLALGRLEVDAKRLHLAHALSARDARAMLSDPELADRLALAVIDVVMESDVAGLELARWMRAQRSLRKTRLVVRSGQPGLAPEESVVRDFTIHDYWPKTETSAQRMRTAVTGLIRSYVDLDRLDETARGAARAVSSDMVGWMGAESFAELRVGDRRELRRWVLACDLGEGGPQPPELASHGMYERLLTAYSVMLPILRAHGGAIDRLGADGLVALFSSEAPPIECCIELRAACGEGAEGLGIGVALHGGPLSLCTLGDGARMGLSAIGAPIVGAVRLAREARESGHGVLISSEAADAMVPDLRDRIRGVQVHEPQEVGVRGFRLLGGDGAA